MTDALTDQAILDTLSEKDLQASGVGKRLGVPTRVAFKRLLALSDAGKIRHYPTSSGFRWVWSVTAA